MERHNEMRYVSAQHTVHNTLPMRKLVAVGEFTCSVHLYNIRLQVAVEGNVDPPEECPRA